MILAGGRGRRLGYKEKALIPIGNRTILDHIIDVLDQVVDEIIVSVRDREQEAILQPYAKGRTIVIDRYPDIGPLAGILEGLKAACGEYVFVTACDMPYIKPGVVEMMFNSVQGHDAAIPVRENGVMEPLHAVYRTKPMVSETKKAIDRNDRIILAPVFKLHEVVYVDVDKIREIDPGLKTFMNINTMEELEQMVKE